MGGEGGGVGEGGSGGRGEENGPCQKGMDREAIYSLVTCYVGGT